MMRPKFSDLPLALKISIAPAFAMIMAGVVAVCTFYMQHEQVKALNNVVGAGVLQSRFAADSKQITAANGDLYSLMTRQAAGGSAAASATSLAAVLVEIDVVKTDLTALQASVPPAEQKNFAQLLIDLTNYRGGVQVVGSMLGIDFNSAASFIAPFQTTYAQMTQTLDATSQAVAVAARQRADRTTARGAGIEKLLLGFLIFTFLLVTFVAGIITVLVRQTVLAICGATEALASGKNDQDLSRLARRDEFGAIVRSLTVFKENQMRMQTMGAEQVALEARQQELRQEQEQVLQLAQEQQRMVVNTLAAALESLASGNLTQNITASFPPGYEKLKNDFNAALSKLAAAMRAVKTAITMMADGSDEILKASSDVSGRTQSQAARLEQTAAAMDEITSTVKRTASSADEANNVVTAAKLDAEKSGAVARDTISAMTSIEKSSKQIVNIISLIDEIAFQTNLLALNAGIEAARAGDAGRGFAVVATEVRALAQRSANAAKEIKALIHASGSQIDNGVKLVAETGKALNRIMDQVNRLKELVTGIAGSAVDQASRLSEVNTVVGQMDQTTQQNAAMVEKTTEAGRDLVQQAEALSRLIGQFSLGDQEISAVANFRRHEMPVLPTGQIFQGAPKPASSATNSDRRGLAVAGAVRDEWDEF